MASSCISGHQSELSQTSVEKDGNFKFPNFNLATKLRNKEEKYRTANLNEFTDTQYASLAVPRCCVTGGM
jgi:hypothetical protein